MGKSVKKYNKNTTKRHIKTSKKSKRKRGSRSLRRRRGGENGFLKNFFPSWGDATMQASEFEKTFIENFLKIVPDIMNPTLHKFIQDNSASFSFNTSEGGASGAKIFFNSGNTLEGEKKNFVLKIYHPRSVYLKTKLCNDNHKARNACEDANYNSNDDKDVLLRDLRDIFISKRLQGTDIVPKILDLYTEQGQKVEGFGVIRINKQKYDKEASGENKGVEEANKLMKLLKEGPTPVSESTYDDYYIFMVSENLTSSGGRSLKKLLVDPSLDKIDNVGSQNLTDEYKKELFNTILEKWMGVLIILYEKFKKDGKNIGCHRDLHPDNVFVMGDLENIQEENIQGISIKLIDFDLSVHDNRNLGYSQACDRRTLSSSRINNIKGQNIKTTILSKKNKFKILYISVKSNKKLAIALPTTDEMKGYLSFAEDVIQTLINDDADLYNYFYVYRYILQTFYKDIGQSVFDKTLVFIYDKYKSDTENITDTKLLIMKYIQEFLEKHQPLVNAETLVSN